MNKILRAFAVVGSEFATSPHQLAVASMGGIQLDIYTSQEAACSKLDFQSEVVVQVVIVPAADFDRITVERDALQLRLDAADQQIDDLNPNVQTDSLGRLHRHINIAKSKLPEDWGIRLEVAQDFYGVYLYDPQGDKVAFEFEGLDFADCVAMATETAIRCHEVSSATIVDDASVVLEVATGAAQERRPNFIELTPAELQSGYDRVKWAEGLIRQLPEDHDGRNSWLLNYATAEPSTDVASEATRSLAVIEARKMDRTVSTAMLDMSSDLRRMAGLIESGETVATSLSWVTKDCEVGSSSSHDGYGHTLLGAITKAQTRLAKDLMQL